MRVFVVLCVSFFAVLCSAAGAPVKVLVAMDFSGSLKTTARLVELGIQIANDTHGSPVTLEHLDTGEDVGTIAQRLETAISKSRPNVIIGAVTSNQALIIGQIAEREKIVFVTPFATNPKVTDGKSYVFRACFDDDMQAATLARFVKDDLRLTKGILLFDPGQSYARGIRDIFNKVLLVTSMEFSGETSLDEKFIEKVVSSKPEFVVVPSYQIEAASVVAKLAPRLPSGVKFIGTDSWGGGRLFENVTRAVKFSGFYVQHWSGQFKTSDAKKLKAALSSPKIPSHLKFATVAMNAPVAIGFDAMSVVLNALEKKTVLADAIRSLKFEGVTGPVEFKGNQTPSKSLSIFKINEKGDEFFKEFR